MSVKTRISALLPSVLVTELKNLAQAQGDSFSSLLEAALQKWFEEKLESEADQLAQINFEDLPDEESWLAVQSV
jgi:hypothetical protein